MKYRVWNVINVPGPAMYIPVNSPKEGILLISHMADVQLKTPGIESNMFGIEEFDPGDADVGAESYWFEWYDDEGYGENDYSVKDGKVIRDDDGLELI